MRVSREERQGSADASVACATESRRIRRMDVDRRTGFHARNARDAPMLLSHALPNHGDSGGWTWTDGPGFTRGTPGMRRCFCRMRYRITADPEDGRGQTDRVSREGRQGCADASVACATESRRLLRAERVPVCFKRTHREGSAMIPHRISRNHACAWPTGSSGMSGPEVFLLAKARMERRQITGLPIIAMSHVRLRPDEGWR